MASTTKTYDKTTPAGAASNLGAKRLHEILKAHSHYSSGRVGPEAISSLLADVRHICDALGMDFAERDTQSRRIYQTEIGLGVASSIKEEA